jgi:hypothetical protein
MTPNKPNKQDWITALVRGFRMSNGWLWVVVSVVLNIFTTISILFVVTGIDGGNFLAIVTAITLVLCHCCIDG